MTSAVSLIDVFSPSSISAPFLDIGRTESYDVQIKAVFQTASQFSALGGNSPILGLDKQRYSHSIELQSLTVNRHDLSASRLSRTRAEVALRVGWLTPKMRWAGTLDSSRSWQPSFRIKTLRVTRSPSSSASVERSLRLPRFARFAHVRVSTSRERTTPALSAGGDSEGRDGVANLGRPPRASSRFQPAIVGTRDELGLKDHLRCMDGLPLPRCRRTE
jgi:hypothetical protein